MAVRPRSGRGVQGLARQLAPGASEAGLTLVELIVAFSLMLILSTMALPVARVKVQREKERRLRSTLSEIRVAIDRYKDMADQGRLGQLDPDNHGYPKSLEDLVGGIEVEPSRGLPSGNPGLEQSRSPRSRPSPIGGVGTQRSGGSQFGGGGAFGSNRPGGGRSSQGGFGSGLDDPLGLDEDSPRSIRFLRSIPVDPMTGRREWGMLSVSDDPQGRSWSGRNVFDVYSLSPDIALDGTRYSEW